MVKIKKEKERENLLDRVKYIGIKDEEILDRIPTTDKSKENANDSNLILVDNILGDCSRVI